jgi:hypothetical protein
MYMLVLFGGDSRQDFVLGLAAVLRPLGFEPRRFDRTSPGD